MKQDVKEILKSTKHHSFFFWKKLQLFKNKMFLLIHNGFQHLSILVSSRVNINSYNLQKLKVNKI